MQRISILISVLAIFAFQCRDTHISGKVVKVADGDTFTLVTDQNQQIRVRLHGIDAPEKNQDFYRVSRDFLSELVMHKTVQVSQKKKDRYGRIVGIVYVEQMTVNEELLRAGLAWHYTEYDNNPDWRKLEAHARRSRNGIWSHPDPDPPWQFRMEKRKKIQR